MLQLVNKTPFASSMFLFPDASGIDTLYVVVKASFEITSTLQIATEQRPVTLSDEYWGVPGKSSLKYATEAHLMKSGTDVIVVGDAMAQNGSRVDQLDVTLSVSDRSQTIRVWGDRQWKGTGIKAWPGKPVPFERMPLVFERAFGGMQTITKSDGTEEIYAEPSNPMGRGFKGKRSFEEIKEELVPNIEDPENAVSSPSNKGVPVGFGAVAPWWAPRMYYAGTYDRTWEKKRAPYLPLDFDSRFFNCAPTNWVFDTPLSGGEAVTVTNMSPGQQLAFEIPTCQYRIEVTVAGKTETPTADLETVLIEPNDQKLYLSWRAFVPCDKKALEVSEVKIEV